MQMAPNIFSLLLSCAAMVFAGTHTANAIEKISVRADSWMPYYSEISNTRPGYVLEILQAITQDKGIKLDHELVAWSRAISLTRRGETDCILAAVPKEASDFIFSRFPIGSDKAEMYKLVDTQWVYTGGHSLTSITLGVSAEYSYENNVLAAYISNPDNQRKILKVYGNAPLENLVHLLEYGRIQAFPENQMVVDYKRAIGEIPDNIVSAGIISGMESSYIACSPANPERSKAILAILEDGILALAKTGKLKTIMEKYGLDDWEYLTKEIEATS